MTSKPNPINVYQGLFIVGLCLALYSIVANVMLYSTFATTATDTVMMQVLAICFDAGKFLLLPAALILWASKHPVLSFTSAISWILLTGLSMTAGFGYLANIQNDKEQQLKIGSNLYASALEDKKLSADNVASLSRYASVDIGALEAQNIELAGLIEANKSHRYFNSQNPTNFSRMKAENARYQAQISANNGKISGYGNYQTAKTSQAQANQEWKTVNAGGGITESMPAIWRYLAMILPYDASTIRSGFITVSSMGAELFATLFLLIFSTHNKRGLNTEDMTVAQYRALQSQLSANDLAQIEVINADIPQTKAEPEAEPQTRKKGDICQCSECGATYTAKHKNHARCTACSTQAKKSYASKHRGR
jgi:hypothetical protein